MPPLDASLTRPIEYLDRGGGGRSRGLFNEARSYTRAFPLAPVRIRCLSAHVSFRPTKVYPAHPCAEAIESKQSDTFFCVLWGTRRAMLTTPWPNTNRQTQYQVCLLQEDAILMRIESSLTRNARIDPAPRPSRGLCAGIPYHPMLYGGTSLKLGYKHSPYEFNACMVFKLLISSLAVFAGRVSRPISSCSLLHRRAISSPASLVPFFRTLHRLRFADRPRKPHGSSSSSSQQAAAGTET